jgi:tungstate transport system substrate-binding protein
MRRVLLPVLFALAALVALFALYSHTIPASHTVVLRVATTTSLYDTGLLDRLAGVFEKRYPWIRVQFIAVGTGRALRLAADGSVCMVLVHAPNLEKLYIEEGVLRNHTIFAYNFFVIVGPRRGPANVSKASSAIDAFRRIYEASVEGHALFVSRGDCSGTYVRERIVWSMARLDPRPRRDPWYISTGSGMAATLRVADEKGAYTLSDIGTFASLAAHGALHNLVILYPRGQSPRLLANVYSAYIVSGCSGDELRAARLFLGFIAGEGQKVISSYRVGGYQLFYPAEGRLQELRSLWLFLARLPVPPECR